MDADVIITTIDRARHTVLVVNDDPAMRYATARMVRAAGFQTAEAATGTDALAALRKQTIAAVLLDVHLPDMNGFEVCRAIRRDPRTSLLPVLHLSAAYVQDEDKVTGLNSGADAYLVHPAEPAVLVATLQALIRARLAEDNLRRSETRFRAIYRQALSGIALLRADGTFADVNPAMERLFGRPHEALVGRAPGDFAPEDHAGRMHAAMAGVLQRNTAWQGETPLLRPDGRRVYVEWNISAHVEPGLHVVVAVDITERIELDIRRLEILEREQAARAVAERQSRTKDDFVAVLSHELRTPLNAIAGWVHILTQRGVPPAVQKGLDAIERNVKAQARIISDILDVSRINSGKLRLERERIDPVDLVTASIDGLRASADTKRLRVELHADAGAHQPAWLDPTRFQQILWNLLTNAIKFSDDGGRIDVRLSRDGDRLTLAVQDHGRGIAPDFLAHLFGRFTQSDSPDNRVHGGLGLGLSIVKHLAELHGGTVSAESAGIGHGATLRVDLPAGTEAAGHTAAPNVPPPPLLGASRPLDGLDVLIVEDNADASEMLTMVLADAGAHVRLAIDYDSALAALTERRPELLLSDIGLPGRDGYELMRQVRLQAAPGDAGPAAIAFTAFSRPQDRARALDAGFDAHVAKPLQPHVLIAAVQALRDRGRLVRKNGGS